MCKEMDSLSTRNLQAGREVVLKFMLFELSLGVVRMLWQIEVKAQGIRQRATHPESEIRARG